MMNALKKIKSIKYTVLVLALAAVIGGGLPLYNLYIIQPKIVSIITEATERDSIRIGTHFARMLLPDRAAGFGGELTPEQLAEARRLELDLQLTKLKIFSPEGRVLYSTIAGDIGQLNQKPYFRDIVAQGKSFSKLVSKEQRTQEDQLSLVDVVETYVPVMSGDTFVGAVEIYYEVTLRKAALTRLFRNADLVIGSLTVIFLLLIVLASYKAKRSAERRELAEHKVEQQRGFLQEIIDGVIDPLLVISLDYRVLLMNRAAHAYLPAASPFRPGMRCHQVSHHADTPCGGGEHPCPLDEVIRTGQSATAIHRHRLASGETAVFELEASPLLNADGTLRGIIEASRNITSRVMAEEQLRRSEEAMKHLAHHDFLTGLPNRLLLQDRLRQALAKSRRFGDEGALLFLDLDGFKEINDSHGHDVGDALLRQVADRLLTVVRETDTVARLGGDEFVVLLEMTRSAADVAMVARKIVEVFRPGFSVSSTDLHVTTSIGIARYPADGVDVIEVMKCADVAMYRAKDAGRNNYQFYSAETPAAPLGASPSPPPV